MIIISINNKNCRKPQRNRLVSQIGRNKHCNIEFIIIIIDVKINTNNIEYNYYYYYGVMAHVFQLWCLSYSSYTIVGLHCSTDGNKVNLGISVVFLALLLHAVVEATCLVEAHTHTHTHTYIHAHTHTRLCVYVYGHVASQARQQPLLHARHPCSTVRSLVRPSVALALCMIR